MSEGKNWRLPAGLERWMAPVLRASRRRVVILCFCAVVVGVAMLLLAKTSPRSRALGTPSAASTPLTPELPSEARRLERELAALLGHVAGAGRVEVRLTLAASTAVQWEQNRRRDRHMVEDRNQDGGVQVTTEETEETTLALTRRADGSEAPVEMVSTPPRVAGAIIVADGAGDVRVRARLTRAAAVFLGIGLHRVMVLSREVGK